MKPKHDLALFDFDGTLADSLPWFRAALQRFAAELQIPTIPDDQLASLRRADTASLVAAFKIPMWRIPRLVATMRRYMSKEVDRISLFNGINAFCHQAAAAGLRLGVVSSNSEENVRAVLGPATAALFTCFECGASLLGKPAKLRRAARRAGTPVKHAIYVGDELRDLDAATKAGMAFAAVTWGWADAPAFAARQPRAIFQTVAEMQSYLLGER